MIVREIGTGDNERVGVVDQFSQRHAECATCLVALITHDDGNQLKLLQRTLQERKLHFQRVFSLLSGTLVPAARQPDRSALLSQRLRKGLVHLDSAQGSDVGVTIVNGGEGEDRKST